MSDPVVVLRPEVMDPEQLTLDELTQLEAVMGCPLMKGLDSLMGGGDHPLSQVLRGLLWLQLTQDAGPDAEPINPNSLGGYRIRLGPTVGAPSPSPGPKSKRNRPSGKPGSGPSRR